MIYKTKNPVLIKRNDQIRMFYKEMQVKYKNDYIINLLALKFNLKPSSLKQIIYKTF